MSDTILLKNMVFYGYHGVYEGERHTGQRFYVDLEIETDMKQAGASDDLVHTVDYTAVYAAVKQVVEKGQYQLLEALAAHIADAALAFPGIEAVRVRVRKPAAAVPGPLDYVQVEIQRRRA